MKRFLFTGMVFIMSLVINNNALAADTDVYANILNKMDGIACTQPEKILGFYGKDRVIMEDDKRALLENRVKAYKQMMADFRGIKCQVQRQVLSGHAGNKVGYVLVDEIASVTSKSVDNDERQHSV